MEENNISNIPKDKIAIFLPHCLKSRDCPAKMGDKGLECINCGRCGIGPFRKKATNAGFKVFIVPGGSMVKKIIENNDFQAVIGVACTVELAQAYDMLEKKDIISLSVPLSKDGCVDTEVDWKEVEEICKL